MKHPAAMLACFSALMTAVWSAARHDWVTAAVYLLAAAGQTLAYVYAHSLGERVAMSGVLLAAAVSSELDLYSRVVGWDLLIHFLTVGVLVLLLERILGSDGVFGRPGLRARQNELPFRLRGALWAGGTLAVVWEVMELWGYIVVSRGVHVTVPDSLTDIVAGLAGALVVALRKEVTARCPSST